MSESHQFNKNKNFLQISKNDMVGGLMDLARLFLKKKKKKQYEYISRCYFDAIYQYSFLK